MIVHGTAVALGSRGILLRGPSGAGKSDLALRLLTAPRGSLSAFGLQHLGPAALIADDQVALARSEDGRLLASSPAGLPPALEVRGLGLIALPRPCNSSDITLVVDLRSRQFIERLPIAAHVELCGVNIRTFAVDPFDNTAPVKVLLAAFQIAMLGDA